MWHGVGEVVEEGCIVVFACKIDGFFGEAFG